MFQFLGGDKNTQTYNCFATLHLTCLFLLLSPNLEYEKKAFKKFLFIYYLFIWGGGGCSSEEQGER